ncbi:MAG: hypothetical protein PUJ95_05430 [Bacteroidales bacterium]|nr:hypothetical protein [Bacteroidales bacterium]
MGTMIKAVIDWSDGMYYISTPAEQGIGVSAMGKTVEKAKSAYLDFLKEYPALCAESGADVPLVLRSPLDIEYTYTISAFLHVFPVSLRDLSDASGLNYRQLSAYKNGNRFPKESTKQKIKDGIAKIGRDLLSARLL